MSGALTERGIPVRDVIPLKGVKRLTAEQMVRGHGIPAVTSLGEVDATELVRLRQTLNPVTGGLTYTYTHFVVKALAIALAKHPLLNSTLADDGIRILEEINIAVAISLPDGNLVAPVVHLADTLSLREIAERVAGLSDRARAGKLTLADVQRGTFTLTSYGSIPILKWSTPMINSPQAAILGVGAIEEKPVARGGQIVIRSMLPLALTYDHRIVNGHPAGLFLQDVADLLASPSELHL